MLIGVNDGFMVVDDLVVVYEDELIFIDVLVNDFDFDV